MSYLIPIENISLASQEKIRRGAETMARTRLAGQLNIPLDQALDPKNPAVIVRAADYVTDFVPVATQAGLAGWLSMPLVAIAGVYSVFADNVPAALTPQVPNNQAWVFYGANVLLADAAAETLTQLIFGTGAAANRVGQFDLEVLYTGMSATGYFSQPVYYDPQDIVTCTVRARIATAVGGRVSLASFVAERIQNTLI